MSWITVAQAAEAVGRSQWTIYSWIRKGRLGSRVDDTGRICIDGQRLIEVEPTVKRGRPHGSAGMGKWVK